MVIRREQEKRGREHGSRPLLRVTEEAPGPLAGADPQRGEVGELLAHRLDPVGHQVQERAGVEPERRPVELVVRDEPGMILAARTREADAVHGRMRGALESLELPERREADRRFAPGRAGERVSRRQHVVHGSSPS
jgi:hypothetical protein